MSKWIKKNEQLILLTMKSSEAIGTTKAVLVDIVRKSHYIEEN